MPDILCDPFWVEMVKSDIPFLIASDIDIMIERTLQANQILAHFGSKSCSFLARKFSEMF